MNSSPIKTRIGGVSSPLREETESEQSWLASVTEKTRENLAKNLNPYGYGNAISRLYSAGIKGEKSRGREDPDFPYTSALDKERVDLLQIVMGQPQEYKTISKSKYKPTEAKDINAEYYSSKLTEDEIKRDLSRTLKKAQAEVGEGGKVDIEQVISSIVTPTEAEKEAYGTETNVSGTLGQFKIDKGVDEKGHYISYYDIWDLNPIPETGVSAIDKGVGKVASYLTKKAGMKSPEIYGRIYYDPKTGEIIE